MNCDLLRMMVLLLVTLCPVYGLRLPPFRIYERQQLSGEIASLFFGEVVYRQYELLNRIDDVVSELQKPLALPSDSYLHIINTFTLFSLSWILSNYWNDRLGYLPKDQAQLFDETMQLSVGTANCILLSFLFYLFITKDSVDIVSFEKETAASLGTLWIFRYIYYRTRPPISW